MAHPQRILYVQYTNPAAYPPVEHSAWMMAEAGWDVLLLGVALEKTLTLRQHPRIRCELVQPSARGWRQKAHYVKFAVWALSHAERFAPHWIYASDMLSSPVALLLAGRRRAGLVYHEHDSPDARGARSLFVRSMFRARRRVARRAAMCVLPNETRRAAFAQVHPEARTITVWNCPAKDEVPETRSLRRDDELRLLYHGSIVPARVPLALIDSLSLLPSKVTLTVAGYETAGSAGYVDALRQRARDLGFEGRLSLPGTIPRREDLLKQCASCDVGVAFMPLRSDDFNERAMVGASNKPFDYMACGLTLVVSQLPDWEDTFVKPGFAVSCNPESPESIATAIREWLDAPERRLAAGERARQRVLDDWHYERAFAPVFTRLVARTADARPQRSEVVPVEPDQIRS